jgi:hypothetical protein
VVVVVVDAVPEEVPEEVPVEVPVEVLEKDVEVDGSVVRVGLGSVVEDRSALFRNVPAGAPA